MKQPLIIIQGLIQTSDEEKVQILRLNLGPSDPVLVTSRTVTLYRTLNHLIPAGQNKVRNILGGEEGDMIVLTGDNVRLQRGGNIARRHNLKEDKTTTLIYISGVWT